VEVSENPATTVDALVSLQDLCEPIVTSSAVSVNLQDLNEPIVTSSAINPSQEKVRYIPELFAPSFLCAVLIPCLLFRV
jgi:hypothetical protein